MKKCFTILWKLWFTDIFKLTFCLYEIHKFLLSLSLALGIDHDGYNLSHFWLRSILNVEWTSTVLSCLLRSCCCWLTTASLILWYWSATPCCCAWRHTCPTTFKKGYFSSLAGSGFRPSHSCCRSLLSDTYRALWLHRYIRDILVSLRYCRVLLASSYGLLGCTGLCDELGHAILCHRPILLLFPIHDWRCRWSKCVQLLIMILLIL